MSLNEKKLAELEALFVELQDEVRKHAVRVESSSLVFSNLVSIKLEASKWGLLDYLMQVKALVEETPIYKKVSKEVEQYYTECAGPVDPEGTFSLPEELQGSIPEDAFAGYGESPHYSALSGWLMSSGFYRSIILERDQSCWKDRFVQFLLEVQTTVGVFDCFLAVDGLRSEPFQLGKSQFSKPDDKGCQALGRLLDFELSFFGGWDTYNNLADDFRPDTFYYLCTSTKESRSLLHPQSLKAHKLAKTLFDSEQIALQLASKWAVSFPNAIVIPRCGGEANSWSSQITRPAARCYEFWEFIGDPWELKRELKDITLGEDNLPSFVRLANEINRLAPMAQKTMAAALDLFMAACETDDAAVAILLYVIALDSLLLGRNTPALKEKFYTRFSHILSPDWNCQAKLMGVAQMLYKTRSDIVHGSKPELLKDDRRLQDHMGLYLAEIRNYVRKALLVGLFAVKAAADTSSKLHVELGKRGKGIPKDFGRLIDFMYQYNDMWPAFYSSVSAAYPGAKSDDESPFITAI